MLVALVRFLNKFSSMYLFQSKIGNHSILDFGFSILDCRSKSQESKSELSYACVRLLNPKSKIENPKFFSVASLLTPHGYLMTLSARASRLGGIVRPICLAVFRLMISSKYVGVSTGRSCGFVPLRIRSTYHAPRWPIRYLSES